MFNVLKLGSLVFHLCFSFSRMFWLSFIQVFIQVLVSACQFLQRTQPGYWYSLQGTCRSFWGKNLNKIKSSDLWAWDVFLFIWIFFNFFQQCFVLYNAQVLHFWWSLFLHVLKCSCYCSVKSQKREMVNGLASTPKLPSKVIHFFSSDKKRWKLGEEGWDKNRKFYSTQFFPRTKKFLSGDTTRGK